MEQHKRLGKTIYAGKGVGLRIGISDRLLPYVSFLNTVTTTKIAVTAIRSSAFVTTNCIIGQNRPPFWIPTPYASTNIIEQVK